MKGTEWRADSEGMDSATQTDEEKGKSREKDCSKGE